MEQLNAPESDPSPTLPAPTPQAAPPPARGKTKASHALAEALVVALVSVVATRIAARFWRGEIIPAVASGVVAGLTSIAITRAFRHLTSRRTP